MGVAASSVSAPSPIASASTAPAGSAVPVKVTVALRGQLLKLYAAYRHLPVSGIARAVPGMVHGAQAMPGGQEWAAVRFVPSARAPASVAAGFQDGAGTGIFTKAPGRGWKMAGLGGEPLGCAAHVPPAVRSLWHLARCGTPAGSRPPARPAQARPGSATPVTNLVADIANNEIGRPDNPAVTNFNGLDCDPFTAFEASWVSTSGCGTDSRFDIKNGSEFWCADFAKWAWAQAGVTSGLSTLTPAAASFYTWGANHGESMPKDPGNPAVGDAVVFYPGTTPNGNYADHVGIVTAVNPDGTVNLVNGDFLGSSNITVQADNNVSLGPWSASIWGSGEDWTFVSPQLGTPGHAVGALVGAQSGKCVDTFHSTFADGTKEQIYTCNGTDAQSWTYTSDGQLTIDGGQYCLDVKGQGTANGTLVDLWTCNGGANQQWAFGANGYIVDTQSGKCLNVSGQSTSNGAQLILWTCSGAPNNQWSWQ